MKLLRISPVLLLLCTLGTFSAPIHAQDATISEDYTLSIAIPLESLEEEPEAKGIVDNMKAAGKKVLWITAKVKRQCYRYGIEDKHEHETFVSTQRGGGTWVPVPVLTLHSKIGSTQKSKSGRNVAVINRTEKEYNMRCRKSCAKGEATIGGTTTSTGWACVN